MRRLIVNADDFASDPARSRGILEGRRRGIVTSTSALANLPWPAGSAGELLDLFGPAVGVHLNLTEGRPLTGPGRTLTGGDGRFHPKRRAWRRALAGLYDPAEVEGEFAAQIEGLLGKGIAPSHLDGNNHLHIFPGFPAVVARLARRYGIGRVRLPLEAGWGLRHAWRAKPLFLGALARRARRVFAEAGLISPSFFAGIRHPRPGSAKDLRDFLRRLPEGVTELMVHPGYIQDGAGGFSTAQREAELRALTDPSLPQILSAGGIELISFADLPS